MKMEYHDKETDCWFPNYREYIWSHMLGFCGCSGESETYTFQILKKIYDESLKEDGSYYYEYKDVSDHWLALQELILMILDKADLTEHGSSVRGCWLTDKGKEVCKKIDELNLWEEPKSKEGKND